MLITLGLILCIHSAYAFRNAFNRRFFISMADASIDGFGLTPVLRNYADRLRVVTDDKLRYQQLLFLASKCPVMDDSLKVAQNKVPGCLSTVYIHAELLPDGRIKFQGDSDSQLTKGLVAMLVIGLTNHYPQEIAKVNPIFIQYAGIAKSLTPGRNNGFLNMLNLMKLKAQLLSTKENNTTLQPNITSNAKVNSDRAESTSEPLRNSMQEKLTMLKPTHLDIENVSYRHAGHAGSKGLHGNETHFNVYIVAEAFSGLTPLQRHRMVYQLLDKELNNGIHALSVKAKTPRELES